MLFSNILYHGPLYKTVPVRDEYAQAVCSTCDGYHCGEGQECVMMDVDDDPSDAESPVCVQRQTGCDDNVRFVSFPIKFINFQCTLYLAL